MIYCQETYGFKKQMTADCYVTICQQRYTEQKNKYKLKKIKHNMKESLLFSASK